ncbi:MAG: hypothetical protein H7833_11265 [Magnetococcus sp. DMHC-1]|nr:hypothetical protein [Magnetococcales bacterium]
MPILEKGSFQLNLGLFTVKGDFSDLDRQCAWELYTEMSTRVAVTGKVHDAECTDFSGEVLVESLDSLYTFFKETRQIMRSFPVGKTRQNNHLGLLINRMFQDVLRPFLEKWQADFRYWWQYQSNPQLSPFERQRAYPRYDEFLNDWISIRWMMRKIMENLMQTYALVDLNTNP